MNEKIYLDECRTKEGGPVEVDALLEWSSKFTSERLLAKIEARTLCLLPSLTLRERKLYLCALEMKGELPDIITAESESLWYGERSLVFPSSSPSSATSFISSSTCKIFTISGSVTMRSQCSVVTI